MDEYDAWNEFFKTGSVMDYLAYTSLKSAREDIYNDQLPEDAYELEHRRSDYKGTEYW